MENLWPNHILEIWQKWTHSRCTSVIISEIPMCSYFSHGSEKQLPWLPHFPLFLYIMFCLLMNLFTYGMHLECVRRWTKKNTRRIAPCCFLISIELHIHLCSCLSKYREIAKIYQRLLCKLISVKSVDIYHQRAGLGLGCLMPLSTMFQYMVAVSFIGAGNLSIRRKPPTCLKSLTNFIA